METKSHTTSKNINQSHKIEQKHEHQSITQNKNINQSHKIEEKH